MDDTCAVLTRFMSAINGIHYVTCNQTGGFVLAVVGSTTLSCLKNANDLHSVTGRGSKGPELPFAMFYSVLYGQKIVRFKGIKPAK